MDKQDILNILNGKGKESIKDKIIRKLKEDWCSYFKIIKECKSGSADRMVRYLREHPPVDYILIERWKDKTEKTNRCKEFKLVLAE